jgi:hypothetical protein
MAKQRQIPSLEYTETMFCGKLEMLEKKAREEIPQRVGIPISDEIHLLDVYMVILKRAGRLTPEMAKRYRDARQPFVDRGMAAFSFPVEEEQRLLGEAGR